MTGLVGGILGGGGRSGGGGINPTVANVVGGRKGSFLHNALSGLISQQKDSQLATEVPQKQDAYLAALEARKEQLRKRRGRASTNVTGGGGLGGPAPTLAQTLGG